jgi:hypothetical protein
MLHTQFLYNKLCILCHMKQDAKTYDTTIQLPSIWDMCTTRGMQEHLTSIKMKQRNRLSLELALSLEFKKICSQTEMLACQKQAQPYL